MHEDRLRSCLRVEQCQPPAVHRIEDRTAGLQRGGRRRRRDDQMGQLGRQQLRAAQHTRLVARGAQGPRVALLGQEDARGTRRDDRRPAAHRDHGVGRQALQFARDRQHRIQRAVRLHAGDHAGRSAAHRVTNQVERRLLAQQRRPATNHRAASAKTVQLARQRGQAVQSVVQPQLGNEVPVGRHRTRSANDRRGSASAFMVTRQSGCSFP